MKRPELPPNARRTSSGRITITIRDHIEGKAVRLSHSKVLASEPATYATPDEAWAGYDRVREFIAKRDSKGVTLGGYWAKWSNVDHHWNEERSEPTVIAYTSRTRGFVQRYAEVPLIDINERHLDEYLENGGILSHVGAISRMFQDAAKRKLVPYNPLAVAAAAASKTVGKRAKKARKLNPPPKLAQVEAMLARLGDPVFPPSLRGWFMCATETGFRGGEVDGMQWEFLEPDGTYRLRWQWNAKLNRLAPCKSESERDIKLSPRVLREVERMRGNGSKYIWTDVDRRHWTHNTRDYWWTWTGDGNPSPRQLVGGTTMYNSTRHYFATRAVNALGLSTYQTSLLLGHKDGGKLVNEIYCEPDHKAAMDAAFDALSKVDPQNVDDLSERRRRRGSE